MAGQRLNRGARCAFQRQVRDEGVPQEMHAMAHASRGSGTLNHALHMVLRQRRAIAMTDDALGFEMGLIRFGGHLSYGGYDVPTDGRHTQAPAAPAI
jgi:hypothetical protein